MISSVKFPLEGKGYLYEKYINPAKPDKNHWQYRSFGLHGEVFDEERYERDMKIYRGMLKLYEESGGGYKCIAAANLIGKEFKFEPGKVNLIFGSNGSGKTTILKCIAGALCCNDGFTEMIQPLEIPSKSIFGDSSYSVDDIAAVVRTKMLNSCEVNHDGGVLYYHNFDNTLLRGMSELGAATGSILEDYEEEMLFRIKMNSVSSGQLSSYIFKKLLSIIKSQYKLSDFVRGKYDSLNSVWKGVGEQQDAYYSCYENYDKVVPVTILLDEIDKSFDIESTWLIYSEILPKFCKEYGVQIICVSHNPLVLTKSIQENEMYNIINLEEGYTAKMLEMLRNERF